jgi:hypothetical protein
MSKAGSARATTESVDLRGQRVTPRKPFYELVFVFALTRLIGFFTITSLGPEVEGRCSRCCGRRGQDTRDCPTPCPPRRRAARPETS